MGCILLTKAPGLLMEEMESESDAEIPNVFSRLNALRPPNYTKKHI